MTALGFEPTTDPGDDFKTNFIQKSDADNDYELSTWLFADSAFTNWSESVNSSSSATEEEKEYVTAYSAYTLRMYCNIKKITVDGITYDLRKNRAGSGCCIRDFSAKGGGYCIFIDSQDADVETKYLNDPNFEVSTSSPYEVQQTTIQNAYTGINTFKIAVTKNEGKPDSWYGLKAQPWPAAAYTEMYRFEKDVKAIGYIYNKPAIGNKKWIDEIKVLKSAFDGLIGGASTLALVAGISSMLF